MEKVKLGDVAIEKRETWTGSTQGVPIIGLEHLVPGEVTLSSWDSDTDNTFSKMFRKGQVLLGRRRVYLKKAVIAQFDGICSGDITVIEAIPGKISSRLLPFVIQNERFFDYAMQGSAGSLSPRVKWEHLKDYEFNLPDYEEQDCLADKLWSALKLRESYQSLLQATDEIVKSRFIEMFSSEPKMSLSEVSKITMGSSPDSKYYNLEKQGLPFYQGKTEFGDMYIGEASVYCKEPVRIAEPGDILMSVRAPVGTVNFNVIECCIGRGLASIRPKRIIEPLYLFYALRLKEADIDALGTGSTFKAINKDTLFSFKIEVGNKAQQNEFVHFAEQADKSKFELKKAIEKIDKVMRALMQ